METSALTVTGLLMTYSVGASGLVAFLWRHYEARLKELREELRAEQREHDQNVKLFNRVLEKLQLTSSSSSAPPSQMMTGTSRRT